MNLKGDIVQCLSCDSPALRKLHKYRAHSRNESRVFRGDLYECRDCALIQLVPVPTAARLAEFYHHEYRSSARVSDEEQSTGAHLTASGGTTGITELLKRFAKPIRILDVGAGVGQKTHAAQAAYPRATITCVETDVLSVERLRSTGFRVISQEWPDAAAELHEPQDAILLSHVLEHVLDPRAFVRSLVEVLSPSGVIVIEVPNDPAWRVHTSDHSPHISFFTPASLRALLQQFGEVLFVDTAAHITRRKRHRWEDTLVNLVPRPVRTLRAVIKHRLTSTPASASRAAAQDEYGGEERFAVRAVVRRA